MVVEGSKSLWSPEQLKFNEILLEPSKFPQKFIKICLGFFELFSSQKIASCYITSWPR